MNCNGTIRRNGLRDFDAVRINLSSQKNEELSTHEVHEGGCDHETGLSEPWVEAAGNEKGATDQP